MEEEKLEYTKMRERIDWSISFLQAKAKELGIELDKATLLHEACEIGRTLFVRSEIQYSGKR